MLPVFYSKSEDSESYATPSNENHSLQCQHTPAYILVLCYMTHISADQQRLIGDINKVKLYRG